MNGTIDTNLLSPHLQWSGKTTPVPETCERILRLESCYPQPNLPEPTNRLIHGDNGSVLTALQAEFTGQVQCIYLDPPYNTDNPSPFYRDRHEHSQWLSMMADRLRKLQPLLRPDGIIFVQIDDRESAYLKVLMDEIFGRDRYLTTLYIQVRYAHKALKQDKPFNQLIEQIHCYGNGLAPRLTLPTTPYNYSKFIWQIDTAVPSQCEIWGGKKVEIFPPSAYQLVRRKADPTHLKEVWASGAILDGNSSGRFFRDYLQGRTADDGLGVLYKVHHLGDDGLGFRYFTGPKQPGAQRGKYYQGVPLKVRQQAQQTHSLCNFLDFAASFGNCRHEGGVDFRSGKKPERLLYELLQWATQPGDWVLDAFAGSGTTGAVAHKMGRRWLMIEQGAQCRTHILPRMQRVVDGQDRTGITALTGWQGGGGFACFSCHSRNGPEI